MLSVRFVTCALFYIHQRDQEMSYSSVAHATNLTLKLIGRLKETRKLILSPLFLPLKVLRENESIVHSKHNKILHVHVYSQNTDPVLNSKLFLEDLVYKIYLYFTDQIT